MGGVMGRRPEPIGDRFWRLVHIDPTDGTKCWEWTGYVNPKGHAYFQAGGRGVNPEPARRVAWRLLGRDLTPGLHLKSTCGNGACVRPDHHVERPAGRPKKENPS